MDSRNEIIMALDRITDPVKRREAFRVARICVLANKEEWNMIETASGSGIDAIKATLDLIEAEEIRTGRVLEC